MNLECVIDPDLKALFFDRVMEMSNFSQYDAIQWIKDVAFGETVLLTNDNRDNVLRLEELMVSLEDLKNQYKERYLREVDENRVLRDKYKDIDVEINGYLNEIEEYRIIIENAGFKEYFNSEEDDDEDDYDEDDYDH